MKTKVIISKKLVLINTFSGVAANVINMGIMLWLYQYLLKKISVEEYSLYPVLMSSMLFLSLLPTVLIGGLSRYIVEAYAKGDEQRVTQIVSTMSVFIFGTGLLVLALGLVFSWYIDFVLTIVQERLWDARIMMALMVTVFVIRLVLMPFQAGLYVRQKFVLLNLINLGQQLLRVAILFILLFCISTRVLWVVVASVSSNMCGVLLILVISQRMVPALRFRRSAIRWPIAREITSFGGWILIAQLSDLIRMNADPIILNKMATPLDVTCFHLGSMPFRQIRQLSSAAQQSLIPPLTAMHAAEGKNRLGSAYLRGGRLGLWATLSLSVPLIIYSRELVELYVGPTFNAASIVIILLLVCYLSTYGHVMLSNLSIAMGNIRPWAIRVCAIQLLNLLITLYLVGVKQLGAIGSALSTCIVMNTVWPIIMWPLGLKIAGLKFSRWARETFIPGVLPGVAAGISLIILRIIAKPSSWLVLGGYVACGLLCYVVVLLVFCLQRQDRNDLRRVIMAVRSYFSTSDRKAKQPTSEK